jgi:tRNA/tmRNA/rRNA uracil-C5-methylase (TrmA/RlmC/RlmD family)
VSGAAAPAADELAPGVEVEVTIGPVAHGGHCVARYDGRVIFVRLAVPGERAIVRITQAKAGSFCRGEVIQVLQADPARIPAPCSHYGPGGCGGCDFQHVQPDRQRELKAEVVAEQLQRLAGIERTVVVEPLPGGDVGWRSRVRWALDAQGRVGPRATRSHRVVPINALRPCLIADPAITAATDTLDVPPGVHPAPPTGPRRRRRDSGRPPRRTPVALPEVVLAQAADGAVTATWPGRPGAAPIVTEHAAGRDFAVAADGFWQPHHAAADVLAAAVAAALAGVELAGRTGWDLYGGVGLFAQVLAEAIGPEGTVIGVESDERAADLAVANLADHPGFTGRCGEVEAVLPTLDPAVAAIVLDPPRSGAGPRVCASLAGLGPDVIVYVACDPAALARDTAALAAGGYGLDSLRAFDTFPQTHHVECVARFVPAAAD